MLICGELSIESLCFPISSPKEGEVKAVGFEDELDSASLRCNGLFVKESTLVVGSEKFVFSGI